MFVIPGLPCISFLSLSFLASSKASGLFTPLSILGHAWPPMHHFSRSKASGLFTPLAILGLQTSMVPGYKSRRLILFGILKFQTFIFYG